MEEPDENENRFGYSGRSQSVSEHVSLSLKDFRVEDEVSEQVLASVSNIATFSQTLYK